MVADGMSGEPAGDIASMSAVLGFEKGFGIPADDIETNMVWAQRFPFLRTNVESTTDRNVRSRFMTDRALAQTMTGQTSARRSEHSHMMGCFTMPVGILFPARESYS